MRVVIVGTGAMGCLLAARLCRVCEVVLYNINQSVVDIINRHGIRIAELGGEQVTYSIPAVTSSLGYEQWADLALMCTKSRATEIAVGAASDFLQPNGYVLSLQNGLGNYDVLCAALGASRVIAGVTSQAATVLSPGLVRHAGEGPTYMGGEHAGLDKIVRMFNRAGIATSRHDNVDSLIWGKLVVNVGINGLTALLRVPNGALPHHAASMDLMRQLVREAVSVARAQGVELPFQDPLEQVVTVCHNTSRNRSSMLQDILRGALTEIDVINGAIVKKGAEVGVPTPVNTMIVQLIHALEETYSQQV
ncbi:ketopantoate reductase family protein [Desulfogranum japonicum]|uniref:ketopantoate reductase family protein n=1 Tax=Desulfogranum japonicum TaxID=231447 RepID=UPI000413234C|nr:2-dehydropantoate 2-reductase [Desulfogranum japonicum]